MGVHADCNDMLMRSVRRVSEVGCYLAVFSLLRQLLLQLLLLREPMTCFCVEVRPYLLWRLYIQHTLA
jgi:hypothetical protein